MDKLNQILIFNEKFVEDKNYLKYTATKNKNKKIVIVSCMDTRLTNLLPNALNLKNGDAKIIKNAGATIIHPFGSTIRSIAIAVYEFDVNEVFIIAHEDCGMNNLDANKIIEKMYQKGISKDIVDVLDKSNIDIIKWLEGFTSVEESVIQSVKAVTNHPLLPKTLIVHGLVINPVTGKLRVIINGNEI